jgi:SAM-dependent methyltransferase
VAQNIYDDEDFFHAYGELARSVDGLAAAPEWPDLRGLAGDVAGRRVVDLGCGYGWFCRWAADQGAAAVLGVDLSERMLARATDWDGPGPPPDARIRYERQDLDRLTLPAGAFDLAYSSLTLHYLDDLDRFLATVHAALAPGGRFVFSAEHPLYTAPSSPDFVAEAGRPPCWPLDGYLDEGPRTTDWLAPGVVKQHRTIATYVTSLLAAGFTLTALIEWGPDAEQIAAQPAWAVERNRPPFLLVAAQRA